MTGYRRGTSVEAAELATGSSLMGRLQSPGSPCATQLDADGWARISLWLDLYGQRNGSFSAEQEQELTRLRTEWAPLLTDPTQAAR
jgi:hypothetical protein